MCALNLFVLVCAFYVAERLGKIFDELGNHRQNFFFMPLRQQNKDYLDFNGQKF
jgi:recombinational DNA repair protein (RecF pathway)